MVDLSSLSAVRPVALRFARALRREQEVHVASFAQDPTLRGGEGRSLIGMPHATLSPSRRLVAVFTPECEVPGPVLDAGTIAVAL